MLDRLISAFGRRTDDARATDQDSVNVSGASHGFEWFDDMRPLQPPAAVNDDFGQVVYEAVSYELKAAGLLQ
ncbi:MAG: hypothetical protein WAP03_15915 [Methylorubrum rhodinum]|uniref:hypothetical protein n=1 Tax=Methylorubrum rhodinum TaxID=29428 RepID=UPI003BAEDC9C